MIYPTSLQSHSKIRGCRVLDVSVSRRPMCIYHPCAPSMFATPAPRSMTETIDQEKMDESPSHPRGDGEEHDRRSPVAPGSDDEERNADDQEDGDDVQVTRNPLEASSLMLRPRLAPPPGVWPIRRWVELYGPYIDEMVHYILARMPQASVNGRYVLVWDSDRLWWRMAKMLHRASANRWRSYVVVS